MSEHTGFSLFIKDCCEWKITVHRAVRFQQNTRHLYFVVFFNLIMAITRKTTHIRTDYTTDRVEVVTKSHIGLPTYMTTVEQNAYHRLVDTYNMGSDVCFAAQRCKTANSEPFNSSSFCVLDVNVYHARKLLCLRKVMHNVGSYRYYIFSMNDLLIRYINL